jgi:hypothetical protein
MRDHSGAASAIVSNVTDTSVFPVDFTPPQHPLPVSSMSARVSKEAPLDDATWTTERRLADSVPSRRIAGDGVFAITRPRKV